MGVRASRHGPDATPAVAAPGDLPVLNQILIGKQVGCSDLLRRCYDCSLHGWRFMVSCTQIIIKAVTIMTCARV